MDKGDYIVRKVRRPCNVRQFIRHPAHIPIEVRQLTDSKANTDQLNNISLGGLAFQSETCWEPSTLIAVKVLLNPPIELEGRVVWCHQREENYCDVGVEFLETKHPSEKEIVEEVCQIEAYKKMLMNLAEDFSDSLIQNENDSFYNESRGNWI